MRMTSPDRASETTDATDESLFTRRDRMTRRIQWTLFCILAPFAIFMILFGKELEAWKRGEPIKWPIEQAQEQAGQTLAALDFKPGPVLCERHPFNGDVMYCLARVAESEITLSLKCIRRRPVCSERN